MADEGAPVPVVRLELKRIDLRELLRIDDLLRTAPLFKALGPETTEHLVKVAATRRLAAGQSVYREGEAGDSLFLVLRGEVALSHGTGDQAVEQCRIQKGDFFGEEEVLATRKRTCNATAAGPADLVEFPHAELARACQTLPAVRTLLAAARDARARAREELSDFLDRW